MNSLLTDMGAIGVVVPWIALVIAIGWAIYRLAVLL